MSNLIEQVLIARGVTSEQIEPKRVSYQWDELIKVAKQVAFKVVDRDQKIGILYDPDVDGLFSGFILRDFLESVGIKNIKVSMNHNKTHGFKDEAQQWVRDEDLSLVFVVDAGSGDSEVMGNFPDTEFIIIDHHDYERSDLPSNVRLLNASEHEPISAISGCGVVYLFIEELAKVYSIDVTRYEKYVGITILSDVCSMLDANNRYYVKQAFESVNQPYASPLFSGAVSDKIKYWGSSHSYLAYSLIPFFNAMIRCNLVDEVLELSEHFERTTLNKMVSKYSNIKQIQKQKEDELLTVSDFVELPGLTIAVRAKQDENYKTFNGVVANRIMRDKNTNVMVVEYNPYSDSFEGSYRGLDFGKTDLLEWGIFGQGHEHACGVVFSSDVLVKLAEEFKHTVSVVQRVDFKVHSTAFSKKEYLELAHFNEYTGKDWDKITVEFTDPPLNFEHLQTRDKIYFEGIELIDFGTDNIREGNETRYIAEPTQGLYGVQFIRR